MTKSVEFEIFSESVIKTQSRTDNFIEVKKMLFACDYKHIKGKNLTLFNESLPSQEEKL